MAKRQVIYAKLHGGDAFIPGIGSLGSTLPPMSKTLDLKMYREEGGDLEIKVGFKNSKKEAAIPAANIQLVVYAPEDSKKHLHEPGCKVCGHS